METQSKSNRKLNSSINGSISESVLLEFSYIQSVKSNEGIQFLIFNFLNSSMCEFVFSDIQVSQSAKSKKVNAFFPVFNLRTGFLNVSKFCPRGRKSQCFSSLSHCLKIQCANWCSHFQYSIRQPRKITTFPCLIVHMVQSFICGLVSQFFNIHFAKGEKGQCFIVQLFKLVYSRLQCADIKKSVHQ